MRLVIHLARNKLNPVYQAFLFARTQSTMSQKAPTIGVRLNEQYGNVEIFINNW